MYVHHLGLCCILSRRVLIYKTDVALQLTKLLLKKLLLIAVTVICKSFFASSMDDCVFCSESLGNGEQTTKLGAKGCDGISKANDLRQADISVTPGQIVHTKCRKAFCSQLSIERDIRKRRYDCTGGSSGMHCACASICQFCISLQRTRFVLWNTRQVPEQTKNA